jgi:hypothetical protein
MELTQASAVLLRFAQLELLQLALLRAFRTALSSRRPLLLKFRIVPCEPYVRDEFVELRQRQRAAALRLLLGNGVEEKPVKISCRLKISRMRSYFFPSQAVATVALRALSMIR